MRLCKVRPSVSARRGRLGRASSPPRSHVSLHVGQLEGPPDRKNFNDPIRFDDCDDRRRHQGRSRPQTRFRRDQRTASVDEGTGRLCQSRRQTREKSLYQELAKARPGYGFVLEEGGRVEGTDQSHTWHIDPLDATTNFLHAIPLFAISIALEREGQIVAGVIYNPANDDMYVTEKGQGAFGGNRRLRVAARRRFVQAIFGCGIPHLGKAAQASSI